MRNRLNRITSIVSFVLISLFLLSACAAEAPRVLQVYSYTPTGGAFITNYNPEDLRRQIKCSITFEVIDEEAIVELTALNYRIRNSVLIVLSELTIPEITTRRDLDEIARRITERVNGDLPVSEGLNLITRAYITEFEIL